MEIPKGSRNKYEYDARLERLVLDRTLYASVVYPCDYGFLLETLGEDGDPLDVLLLVTSPTFPGCLVPCRPVGVHEMHETPFAESSSANAFVSAGPPQTMNGLMSLAMCTASARAAVSSAAPPVPSTNTSLTLRPYVS